MSVIHRLSDLDQLEGVIEASHQRPVWIFKHSLICGISSRAWAEYREFVDRADSSNVDFALIEIQNARPVSAALAERTGVRHQSPQAILLDGGRPRWHASHGSITAHALAEATSLARTRHH